VYGDSYLHREIYDPEQFLRMARAGQVVSAVALDSAGQVVGHYAIERPDLGRIGEMGEAMVVPEHRRHHLMERMRTLLNEEGRRLGLVGTFGEPVTNHVFSQKADDRFHSVPCGVSLGLVPASVHNLATPSPQRLTCLLVFNYLQVPSPVVVHAPARHRDVLKEVYANLNVPAEFRDGRPGAGAGVVEVKFLGELLAGLIRVRRTGVGALEEIRRARRDLTESSRAEVIYLELPLAQAATPELCEAAEADGFFFSGLGPCFTDDGDVLRLQLLNVPLDTSLIQIENPQARTLLNHVERERRRDTLSPR
jgi:hypothetical protein